MRRLARHHLAQSPDTITLQPTDLVHEAYLSLVDSSVRGFDNRHQFFALASKVLRSVLIDHLRARRAGKRGGDQEALPLELVMLIPQDEALDVEGILSLNDALRKLEAMDPRRGRLVELRYFGGLTLPEIAELLEISVPTAERDWRLARRWLARRLAPRSSDLEVSEP